MKADGMRDENLHLVEWLQRIQTGWELDSAELARITHVPVEVLSRFLELEPAAVEDLPSVPAELLPAVPLVGLYRKLLCVYPTAALQNEWLKRPNSVFEGIRPIDALMMSSEHVSYVAYAVESGLTLTPRESEPSSLRS